MEPFVNPQRLMKPARRHTPTARPNYANSRFGVLWLLLATTAAAFAAMSVCAAEPTTNRYEFTEPQMGVPVTIVVYAADEAAANQAVRAAFRRISDLNAVLSDYEDGSELNRLSRSSPHPRPVMVSDDLFTVLWRAHLLSEQTDGAFDVSVGPLVQLWRRARRQHALPTKERLERALTAVDYRAIQLDAEHKTVRLTKPKMRLDLGGIGMGYAVDAAIEMLKKHGIQAAMVDGSGDIGTLGTPPGATGWRIGIAPDGGRGIPTRYVMLANRALALSGDAYQYVEIDGVRYSHIVNPHTGLGLTEQSSVTVIADDCTTADSYATAASVLGTDEGLKLITQTPHAEALSIRLVDGKPHSVQTKGWAGFERSD
jgi:thiamine biosynthesis lipoprotein